MMGVCVHGRLLTVGVFNSQTQQKQGFTMTPWLLHTADLGSTVTVHQSRSTGLQQPNLLTVANLTAFVSHTLPL